jgi:hypothetical protein
MIKSLLCFALVWACTVGPCLFGQSVYRYFPQLVLGEGSTVRIGVQNLGTEPITVSYKLLTVGGQSVADGGASGIQPQGVTVFNIENILENRGVDLSTLGVYWLRFYSVGEYGATGIQSLRVGGEDLLPYGVLPAPACSRSGVIVAENERFRAGLVILNTDFDDAIACDLVLTQWSSAQAVAETALEIAPFSQTGFFLDEELDYTPGESRGLVVTCSGEAVVYSLLQDRMTGDTNAVASTCSVSD